MDNDYDDTPLTRREQAVIAGLMVYSLCAAIGLTWLLIQIIRQVIHYPWLLLPVAVGLVFFVVYTGDPRSR